MVLARLSSRRAVALEAHWAKSTAELASLRGPRVGPLPEKPRRSGLDQVEKARLGSFGDCRPGYREEVQRSRAQVRRAGVSLHR